MANRTTTLPPFEHDPNLLHRIFFVQQVCLVLAVQISLLALVAKVYAPLGNLLPASFRAVHSVSAMATLFCALGLFLLESDPPRRKLIFARAFVFLALLLAISSILESSAVSAIGLKSAFGTHQSFAELTSIPLISSCAFALLSLVILFARADGFLTSRFVDALACCLSMLVLILFSEFILRVTHTPGSSSTGLTSVLTLVCLILLTLVALLRRAERGIFSVFLGYGIGSRIARVLAPFLLVFPLMRELGRARLLNAQLVPSHYTTAVMSALASLASFAFLIFIVWRINSMQSEIQDLTLRDEMTGLYNVRGFNLLAEQALRLARRAQQPFGVIFIDLDNLKTINDKLGHSVGSAALVETAKLLNEIFRETDVIGRIGGDEFLVAGQLDREAITSAIDRLQASAASKTEGSSNRFSLSFSSGFAEAHSDIREPLKDIVARADKAMYEEKRQKKLAPS